MTEEEHLKIFFNKSILFHDNKEEIFLEGSSSPEAKSRFALIISALKNGFLQEEIDRCKTTEFDIGDLKDEYLTDLQNLVASITSEVGRAVVGLTILQLSIKCVCPEQSIRLHKTSWREGIAMRSLDASYNTPILRKNGLISINRYGVFMTRTLAENYPYTKFYKAPIKGAKQSWINIVEALEKGNLNPRSSLRFILVALIRETDSFQKLSEETIAACESYINTETTSNKKEQIQLFISLSSYSARLLEIAMHSLMQVLEDELVLPGDVKQLSQMRSANKKHGNIADIEITSGFSDLQIIEAYDAKYGKPYLRDELEELADKLQEHPETKIAGFITEGIPDLRADVIARKNEIEELYGLQIKIQSFSDWIEEQLHRTDILEGELVDKWIRAFTETLCQRRRHRAPIDEPVNSWVGELKFFFEMRL